ncbi:MAG TPA: response regulator [Candidatus Nitrosotalea sp.]|nr:response regulator [Candidatus Nitrosotalea sp.]
MGLQILSGEDNEFAALQYRKIFEKNQHSITIARDGEECVMKYKKALENCSPNLDPFDVVLLDFVMPKKNGVRVAKEILDLRPHQKIIFASAFGSGILDDASAILRDSIEILQKPFSLDFLVKKIENACTLKSLH